MQGPEVTPPQTFGQNSTAADVAVSPMPLTSGNLVQYSAFALPLGFVGIPLYLYAPDFYAVEYGVSLGVLSLVLLCLRLFDAVQDPYIGLWSDRLERYRSRIVSASSMIMAVAFVLLFIPPFTPTVTEQAGDSSSYALILWFAALTLLATTAFSVLTVNHNAIGALWSDKADQKARVVSYRELLGLFGLMIALVIPAIFQEFVSRQQSLLYFGGLVFAASLVANLMFKRWLSNAQPDRQIGIRSNQIGINAYWMLLFSKQGRFFQAYALSVLASAFPAVLVLMFVRDYLMLEASFPLFMLSYILAGIVFMPVWKWLGSKLGLTKAWMVAMVVGIVAFVGVIFISAGDQLAFLVICIATGAVFGADIIIPQTHLSILVHKRVDDAHELQASSLFALLAFLGKTSLALATGLALLFLDIGGFKPDAENSANGLFVLLTFYAIIPCGLKLGAALLLISLKDERKKTAHQRLHHET